MVLAAYNQELVLCDWKYRKMRSSIDKRIQDGLERWKRDSRLHENDDTGKNEGILEKIKNQLDGYFAGDLIEFDIPLRTIGTDFQKQVWDALINIPYGETRSYLQLSQQLGNEKAIRAVASANGANALSILIPCHRIIGSNGELTGYAGGLTAKKKLLELENPMLKSQQLDLF